KRETARRRFVDLTDDRAKSVFINWFRNSKPKSVLTSGEDLHNGPKQ
ncbi:unnamed protein product, partial [Allacma fusca]